MTSGVIVFVLFVILGVSFIRAFKIMEFFNRKKKIEDLKESVEFNEKQLADGKNGAYFSFGVLHFSWQILKIVALALLIKQIWI